VIGPSQRPLPDNTQHSQEKDIHASGGIRTHKPRKPAAEPLLAPNDHWGRQVADCMRIESCLINPYKILYC